LRKLICAGRHQRNFLFPAKKNSDKPDSSVRGFCALSHLPVRFMPCPVERAANKQVNPNQGEDKKPAVGLEYAASQLNETK